MWGRRGAAATLRAWAAPDGGAPMASRQGSPDRRRGARPGRRVATALAAVAVASAALAPGALAATFDVDTTADSAGLGLCELAIPADCSLRDAIARANAAAGSDLIEFSIPTPGVHTIAPVSTLPALTGPVTIDATTQEGFVGAPLIVLNGGSAGADADGLTLNGGSSEVRGLVVNGFATGAGIVLGSSGNFVAGNWIGTNAAGTAAVENRVGVRLVSGAGNAIGGIGAGDLNVIAGQGFTMSFGVGIDIQAASSANVVEGNYLGVTPTGLSIANTGFSAIRVNGSSNRIGGSSPEYRNVISGNNAAGIYLGGSSNIVEGNYIGLKADGSSIAPNAVGIEISGSDNTVGGSATAARNVISGNEGNGVLIFGETATGNELLGNLIGTDATGTADRGNDQGGEGDAFGIQIGSGATGNVIGGTGEEPGNVISGNETGGIDVLGDSNEVLGNRIGTSADGSEAIPNGDFVAGPGVGIAASGTTVRGNTIAHNAGDGIEIRSGTGNDLEGNLTSANGGLGVDLAPNGVTANDPGDADAGANDLQNFPVLHAAALNGDGDADVAWSLDSAADTLYRIEFFASDSCDASGNGEGAQAGGTTTAATDASGDAGDLFTVAADDLGLGSVITATATDPDGNTSELSGCVTVADASLVVDTTGDQSGGACTPAADDCSLRSAIELANATAVPDRIVFSIGAGPQRISPAGGLPAITETVEIDATTQPGHLGAPIVEIDGSGASEANGLVVTGAGASGTTIRGLVVNLFGDGYGIAVRNGADDVTIQGNWIGVDSSANYAFPNGAGGVLISAGSERTLIGGNDAEASNVISGNAGNGVTDDGTDTAVQGNYIGTNATSGTGLGNTGRGIEATGTGTRIGGGPDERNVISGNGVFGVFVRDATDVEIQRNRIGTSVDGELALGNGLTGVQIEGASTGVTVGGFDGGGNVISGNVIGLAVLQAATADVAIVGNLIGTDADGNQALGNTAVGIDVDLGATGVQIGSGSAGNVISANGQGIEITGGADSAVIQGNTIGLDADGVADLGNMAAGIYVSGVSDTTVGGTSTGARNVIAGNDGGEIVLAGATQTAIQGNVIGTNASASIEGDGTGIAVGGGSTSTTIGGAATVVGQAPGNVISGNDGPGIRITGAGTDGTVVRGNLIGLTPNGLGYRANYGAGIEISGGAQHNVVGNDTGSGSDLNAIANSYDTLEPGVLIDGAGTSFNTVVGNLLGTNVNGTDSEPNSTGVTISGGATWNTVGGTSAALRNLISGNDDAGVEIIGTGTSDNSVLGNWIGTTLDGSDELPNGDGVLVANGATLNSIGGAAAGAGNVIAGNDDAGVQISGGATTETLVKGNTLGRSQGSAMPNGVGVKVIGSDGNLIGPEGEDGEAAANTIAENDTNVLLSNGADENEVVGNQIVDSVGAGVRIDSGVEGAPSNDNLIARNTISGNGSTATGVSVLSGTGNTITQNSIHDNIGLGIDLGGDGVTFNDYLDECDGELDCDGGPNERLNFPDLDSALAGAGTTTVTGTLSVPGDPDAGYRVEFFSSSACDGDGPGFGEGETYLGDTVVTAADGTADLSFSIEQAVPLGYVITATTTDPSGNTSEFSACVTVEEGGPESAAITGFGSDSSSSPAGAEEVLIDDIPPSALKGARPQATGGTQQGTALDSIPLDSIPLDSIPLDSIALDSIPLDSIGLTPSLLRETLGGVHLSDIPLRTEGGWNAALAGTPLAGAPLNAVTLADVMALANSPTDGLTLGQLDLAGTALDSINLAAVAIGPLALDSIPVDSAEPNTPTQNLTEWCAELNRQGVPCSSTADLAGTTLIEATLRGAALDSIPLDSIPLDSINLAGTALDSIPLDSIAPQGTALDSIPLDSIDVAGTALDSIPLDSIAPQGTALDSIPLDSIDVAGTALDSIPLDSIDIAGTALDSIALDSIAPGSIDTIVDCSGGWCDDTTKTLGDAVAADRIRDAATIGHLVAALEGSSVSLADLIDALPDPSGATIADLIASLPAGTAATVADLIAALVEFNGATVGDLARSLPPDATLGDLLSLLLGQGQASYDWEALPLGLFPIQDFATDGATVDYELDFAVSGSGGPAVPTTIEVTLPAGARYKSGSSVLHSNFSEAPLEIDEPQQSTGSLKLTWTVDAEVGATYALSFEVRPGLALGSLVANAALRATGLPEDTAIAPPVQIGQTLETGSEPSDGALLREDALYFGHITRGDSDYVRIPIPSRYGARTILDLSHLAADYDLVVFGPQNPDLAPTALDSIPLGNEPLIDSYVPLTQHAQELPPETLQDVALDSIGPGTTLRATSDNRGTANEHLELISFGEGGFYTVRIDPYEDAESPEPYMLRVSQEPPPTLPACAPRDFGVHAGEGVPGSSATIPPGVNTLFLVNQQRLGDTYGETAATSVVNSLGTLAARTDLGVTSAVVSVESDAAVAAAYAAWDLNPCSPRLAQDVALAISRLLDTLITPAMENQIENIVIVGGDDIVPFSRVPDESEIANERGYTQSLGGGNNQFIGSFAHGFLMTDDIYGDRDPKDWFGRQLYTPERALGRLVEEPVEIVAQVEQFKTRLGRITPTTSLVTGYSFLTDGANAVNAAFAGFGANARTLIDDSWTRQNLVDALFPSSGAPQVNSINAHFDHNRALPAALDNAPAHLDGDLFTTGDIPAGKLDGRLLFTMGCHSGFAAANAIFGPAVGAQTTPGLAEDFAETTAEEGAVAYIGNTGYGLGDTVVVAYSERLHALFADALRGRTTGKALVTAKQQYIGVASGTVLTLYDEKVSVEATHYGLPMYRYGPDVPAAPPASPPSTANDPITGLTAASFDLQPQLNEVDTANGKYFQVAGQANGGIEVTPRRPIQPLSVLDMTQPSSVGIAHGAVLEHLVSPPDRTAFDAAWSRVEIDSTEGGPELVGEGSSASKLQAITTVGVPGGSFNQQLLLLAGQFRSDGTPDPDGIGIQTLYTRQQGKVYYAPAGERDFTAPLFGPVDIFRVGSTVGFAVDVTDADESGDPGTVRRVLALYRDCDGVWRKAELAKAAASNRWSGGGAIATGCAGVSYFIQARRRRGQRGGHLAQGDPGADRRRRQRPGLALGSARRRQPPERLVPLRGHGDARVVGERRHDRVQHRRGPLPGLRRPVPGRRRRRPPDRLPRLGRLRRHVGGGDRHDGAGDLHLDAARRRSLRARLDGGRRLHLRRRWLRRDRVRRHRRRWPADRHGLARHEDVQRHRRGRRRQCHDRSGQLPGRAPADPLHEQRRRRLRRLLDRPGRQRAHAGARPARPPVRADVGPRRLALRLHEHRGRRREHLGRRRRRPQPAQAHLVAVRRRARQLVAERERDRLRAHHLRQRRHLEDQRGHRHRDPPDEPQGRRGGPDLVAGRQDRVHDQPGRELRDLLAQRRRRERGHPADQELGRRRAAELEPRRRHDRLHEQPHRQLGDLDAEPQLRLQGQRGCSDAADVQPRDRLGCGLVDGRRHARLREQPRRRLRDLRAVSLELGSHAGDGEHRRRRLAGLVVRGPARPGKKPVPPAVQRVWRWAWWRSRS